MLTLRGGSVFCNLTGPHKCLLRLIKFDQVVVVTILITGEGLAPTAKNVIKLGGLSQLLKRHEPKYLLII